MKLKIIILLLFLLNLSLSAQKLKYDDIIEEINQKDYRTAYNLLFDYQQTDPDFPNTYFQLGNISYYWAKNSDPFLNLDRTEYYIKNTKLFFGLAISKLNAQNNDAKRNDDYYKTAHELKSFDKLDNTIVIDFISKRLEKIEEFDKNIHQSVFYFENTIRTYNNTIELFNQIITENKNLDNIYIQPKISTLSKTNQIILAYDSTLYFYQLYKNSITNYPIKSYKQVLVEKNINTYRLQGLTSTNFLNDTIYIWNFKEWAKTIQNKLSGDISHFRETITKTNKALTEKENEINRASYSNSISNFILDQKVLFEIEKYDFNSIITDLFKYKKSMLDLSIQSKKTFNDTSNFTIKFNNRLSNYYKLSLLKNTTDSLLNVLSDKVTSDNYLKHKDFLDFNFQNIDGLNTYISTQKQQNSNTYNSSTENLKYFLFRDIYFQKTGNQTIEYRGHQIQLYIDKTNPPEATTNKYYTTAISSYQNSIYIAGYIKTNIGASAFIAKITDNEVDWLKSSSSGARAIDYGAQISSSSAGCVIIVHTIHNNRHTNTLIQLSELGQQQLKHELNSSLTPRILIFDEINSNVVVAFHGYKFCYFNETSDSVKISKLNLTTKEFSIDKEISLSGNIVSIIKIDTTYNILTNCKKINTSDLTLNFNQTKALLIKTSQHGKIIASTEIPLNQNFWLINAFKINNKTINLICSIKNENYYQQSFGDLSKLDYVLIKPNGKIIFPKYSF